MGVRMKLRLKRGVERKLVWSRPETKIAPFCSICLAHIPDDDVPLMIWNEEGGCAQFCEACAQAYIETDKS
jgi:hypothetical protein